MEDVVSFVVVGVDTTDFPPRQYSVPFWGIPSEYITYSVAGAVAAAYEALGHTDIEFRIIPIKA